MGLHGFRLQADLNRLDMFSFYINVDVDTEISATQDGLTYICNLKASVPAEKKGLRVLILAMVYR